MRRDLISSMLSVNQLIFSVHMLEFTARLSSFLFVVNGLKPPIPSQPYFSQSRKTSGGLYLPVLIYALKLAPI